jgi:NhaA family Na+:H+ antiporter
MILHPWVAFCIMPIFALANAGVQFSDIDLSAAAPQTTAMAVLVALVLGKPLGVFICTWLAVKSGLCSLPEGLNWRGVLLVGLLAGIGFTMSIFVGGLAFADAKLLGAAKLGILAGHRRLAGAGLWLCHAQAPAAHKHFSIWPVNRRNSQRRSCLVRLPPRSPAIHICLLH